MGTANTGSAALKKLAVAQVYGIHALVKRPLMGSTSDIVYLP
jgi:hypothetical protein